MPWELISAEESSGNGSTAPVHLRYFRAARNADPGEAARERARRAADERISKAKSSAGAPGLHLELGRLGHPGGGGKHVMPDRISASGWLLQTDAQLSARKPLRGVISMCNSAIATSDSAAPAVRASAAAHQQGPRDAPAEAGACATRPGRHIQPAQPMIGRLPLELLALLPNASGVGHSPRVGGGVGANGSRPSAGRSSGEECEAPPLSSARLPGEGWRAAPAFTPRGQKLVGTPRGRARCSAGPPPSARRGGAEGVANGEGGLAGAPPPLLTPRDEARAAQRRNATGVMMQRLQSKEWAVRKRAAGELATLLAQDPRCRAAPPLSASRWR
jgi:hypothetical protein